MKTLRKERPLFSISDELKQIPFLRIVVALILGICLQSNLPIAQNLIFTILLTFIFLVVIYHKFLNSYRNYTFIGICIIISFILLGMCLIAIFQNKMNHNLAFAESTATIGVIDEPPVEKANSIKLTIRTEAIYKKIWHRSEQKLIVYLKKEHNKKALKPGDRLFINSKLLETEGVKNPHEFNYKKNLYFKHICLTTQVDSGNWRKLESHKSSIKYKLYALREKIIGQYSNAGITGNEYAVLSALVWGYTGELNSEIYTTYASTGAMHILSVSGMHVAIVYVALGWLIMAFSSWKHYHKLKAVFIITGIWFYAIISGMSPSVMRAATMLSFLELGNSLNRKNSSINNLFIAAFILLVYDPFQMFDVGFQLSFTALLGILLFYNKIYSAILTSNSVINKISKLIAVSLAAQIGTLPLCLFYFHQFPNYFMLANIFVVPLSSGILYMGIGYAGVANIDIINKVWAAILNILVKLMNWSLEWIESLPGAVLYNIDFSFLSTILLFGFILSAFAFITYKKYNILLISLLFLLAFAIENSVKSILCYNQRKIIVYNIYKHNAIDFVKENKHSFVSQTALPTPPSFNTKGFYTFHRIKTISKVELKDYRIRNSRLLFFENKKLLILNDTPIAHTDIQYKTRLDYLILSKGYNGNIRELSKYYIFDKLIIDSSVKKNITNRIQKDCEKLKIECYVVEKEGALIGDI